MWERAFAEIRAGAKRGHWMWFVFPQIAGLGRSDTARHYAIAGGDEAEAFLAHPMLGPRLARITDAMLGWAGRRDAGTILGAVDTLKFRSSMTLFDAVDPLSAERWHAALSAFFDGPDPETLCRL